MPPHSGRVSEEPVSEPTSAHWAPSQVHTRKYQDWNHSSFSSTLKLVFSILSQVFIMPWTPKFVCLRSFFKEKKKKQKGYSKAGKHLGAWGYKWAEKPSYLERHDLLEMCASFPLAVKALRHVFERRQRRAFKNVWQRGTQGSEQAPSSFPRVSMHAETLHHAVTREAPSTWIPLESG